jgi:ribulose-phosphate 3-epimerase
MKLFPSLISADLLNLQTTINRLDPWADGYHIDIMDGHFVPNITWGQAFITAIEQVTNRPLDMHLMVDDPTLFIEHLTCRHGHNISFHIETTPDPLITINLIKEKKLKPGLAISPKTPLQTIEPFLSTVDFVLVMSVEPGKSGQPFIHETIDRFKELKEYCTKQHLTISFHGDGGINATNIKQLLPYLDQASIAAGIFKEKDPVEALRTLRDLVVSK